jgi:hypothetical protein
MDRLQESFRLEAATGMIGRHRPESNRQPSWGYLLATATLYDPTDDLPTRQLRGSIFHLSSTGLTQKPTAAESVVTNTTISSVITTWHLALQLSYNCYLTPEEAFETRNPAGSPAAKSRSHNNTFEQMRHTAAEWRTILSRSTIDIENGGASCISGSPTLQKPDDLIQYMYVAR